jgi:peptidase E
LPVSAEQRRIFAFSGVLKPEPGGPTASALVDLAISLTAASRPVRRLCYLPTAVGDRQEAIDHYTARFIGRDDVELSVLRLFTQPSVPDVRAHLLSQDVILVEGGSVVNLVAVWTAHGLPQILRECWEAGIVLTGASAGSLCWHIGGPTDSFRDNLDPFTGGLAFLPYSNGVHDDLDDQPRRTAFRELIATRKLPAGYATEDGVGLVYAGTRLLEAVTILPGKRAWHVTPDGNDGYTEQAIVPRLITATIAGLAEPNRLEQAANAPPT